jgi:PIN domain nuclease of toxin-antitoxin system
MKYLVDTNAYYFLRQSPQKLTRAASQVLTSGGHEFLLSVITPWELAIKAGIGKLSIAHMLMDFENRET